VVFPLSFAWNAKEALLPFSNSLMIAAPGGIVASGVGVGRPVEYAYHQTAQVDNVTNKQKSINTGNIQTGSKPWLDS